MSADGRHGLFYDDKSDLLELEIYERSYVFAHELYDELDHHDESEKFHHPRRLDKKIEHPVMPSLRNGVDGDYEGHHNEPDISHLDKRHCVVKAEIGEDVLYYQPRICP